MNRALRDALIASQSNPAPERSYGPSVLVNTLKGAMLLEQVRRIASQYALNYLPESADEERQRRIDLIKREWARWEAEKTVHGPQGGDRYVEVV